MVILSESRIIEDVSLSTRLMNSIGITEHDTSYPCVEDMIHMHVTLQPGKWEEYLHLVEFSYNNGYHESLKMSPFEVLYGRKCQIPTNWNSPKNKMDLGPNMLEEMEKMVKKVR